jgi:phage head maturation protease
MELRTTAPATGLEADAAKRTIHGLVVPWDTYATVATGQTVAFARGSLTLGDRSKLVLDHDPNRPVGVYLSSADTADGLTATFRVPKGPAGDTVLAEAGDGLRDGLSVAADVSASDDTDDGIYVTAARGRHVALLSEPAFDTARVSAVHAQKGAPMTDVVTTPPETPQGPQETLQASAEVVAAQPVPTAAGLAAAAAPIPVRVRDPYPYEQPHEMGGPSFLRDAWSAMEQPGSPEADRWRRSQAMAADPAFIRAGMARLSRFFNAAPAGIQAATGTTVTDTALVPPHWMPERYVPLLSPKAPLYTALAKYGVPDFTTLQVPRTLTETGLAGTPTDEVTPIAPGDITTGNDTITINEVEGAYNFSRKLLMGSNPQIDRIALDALDRAWLAEVEKEAVTYFVGGASVHTAVSATYADGKGFINALRGQFANMAAGTLFEATVVIPPSKEYVAAATMDDTTGRALLPYLGPMNSTGTSTAGYGSLSVQGVPLMPGPYQTATKTLILDQSRNSATVWTTPIMDFRLEWTDSGAAGGGNVKVLKLVKYSGVGFWSQYPAGVILMTNTTPIILEADTEAADGGNGGNGEHEAKAKK